MTPVGSVHLVGAGPGAPDLLTLRGRERLRVADVVLYDRLVSPALLDEAPAKAERIDVGKVPARSGQRGITQSEICALLVARARCGEMVVRLKGGDPFVFGRGAEELDACRAAGIPCEVVPGLSSALAAPAAAGISVTERGIARSFSVETAWAGAGEPPLDRASPERANTRIVLMGVERLSEIVANLIATGVDASTPAALVASASLPGERVVISTLARLVSEATGRGIEPPAVLIVGAVAGRARPHDTRLGQLGSLAGATVALTRPDGAARRTRALLAPTGARVVSSPLIDIAYREDAAELDTLAADVRRADWVAFTSRHGVEGLWRALRYRGLDARVLAGTRLAVVGPATGAALAERGLVADLVAEPHRGRGLVSDLVAATRGRFLSAGRVLFAGGSRARRELVDGLRRSGLEVDERTVYDTVSCAPSPSFRRELDHGVDAVVFASPSAAASFRKHRLPANDAIAICLGPTTAKVVKPLGFRAQFVATRHDDGGLVDTLLQVLTRREARRAAPQNAELATTAR